MTPELEKQILVAGVGNAWLQDDAFGGECARAPARRAAARRGDRHGLRHGRARPRLRGHARLRRAGAARRLRARAARPGTLYVIEPDARRLGGPIEDGEMIDPHGMDPQTVLRFVNAVGGWLGQGRRRRRASRARSRTSASGSAPPVEAAVERALDARGRDDRRAADRRRLPGADARALDRVGASSTPRVKHADGRRVTVVQRARRAPAPGRARRRSSSTSGSSPATTVCEGARLEQELDRRRGCAATAARSEWEIELPAFRCPRAAAADVAVLSGEELEVESIEVEEEAACTA